MGLFVALHGLKRHRKVCRVCGATPKQMGAMLFDNAPKLLNLLKAVRVGTLGVRGVGSSNLPVPTMIFRILAVVGDLSFLIHRLPYPQSCRDCAVVQRFDGLSLRLYADVRIVLQHLPTDMPCDGHQRLLAGL